MLSSIRYPQNLGIIYKPKKEKERGNTHITSFVNFDNAIVADFFKQAKERDFVFLKTRPRLIGAYILDENRCEREGRQN